MYYNRKNTVGLAQTDHKGSIKYIHGFAPKLLVIFQLKINNFAVKIAIFSVHSTIRKYYRKYITFEFYDTVM